MEEFTVPGKLDELELPPGASRLDVASLGVDEAEALADRAYFVAFVSPAHRPARLTHAANATRRVWGPVRQRRHVRDGGGRAV